MRRRLPNVVTLVLLCSVLALGALTFEPINRPGAVDTLASGINAQGWIVGTSETSAQAHAGTEEGFLLRGNTYKTIFFPTADDTDLGGINHRGVIFGTYGKGGADYCFTWTEHGGYKTVVPIPVTGAKSPDCNGINEEGDLVGSFVTACAADDPECSHGHIHGFLITHDGNFKQLDFPGAIGTEAFGINADGDIVGTFLRNPGNDGAFVLHKGTYTEINVPHSISVDAYGISNRGDIVGSYSDQFHDHGYLLSSGKLTTIDVPFSDALETNKVTGINDDGWMVGVYTDKSDHEHGFKVRKP